MKNTILIVVLFLASVVTLHAQGEKIEVDLTQPGKPYSLELSLIHGSIKVLKHSGNNIIIEATNAGKKTSSTTKDGMRKISSGGSFEFTVEENANKIKVRSGLLLNSIAVTLHVPANGTFNLKTINDGNILVENVDGVFELTNVNGKITLNNVSGSAVANTINGDIKASFIKANSNTPMAFSTLNGNIDLSFPATYKTNIKAKTDQGDIYSDFEVAALKTSANVSKKTSNGYTKIESSEWVSGAINGGGAETMLKTFHGDIFIRKSK